MASSRYWLLKAEPDSRVVKGKDVKFSVDDFESVKTSPWEGVRNYEARNIMKDMIVGEKALFYHSNCKNPGIAAFAEVSKEAYPDYTAWDASHPYYDPKSNPDDPRWFMVGLTFVKRATHFVPLALLRFLCDTTTLPPEIDYIQKEGYNALKTMDLVGRGRLSVQRVEKGAWDAIVALAERGGWEGMDLKAKKAKRPAKSEVEKKPKPQVAKNSTRKIKDGADSQPEEKGGDDDDDDETKRPKPKRGTKRKGKGDDEEQLVPPRRTIRMKQ